MKVHVYRNRSDDDRGRDQMHFCSHCGGWYGVSHEHSHCQKDRASDRMKGDCACRFCKERIGQPVTGTYGFYTTLDEWQPPQ